MYNILICDKDEYSVELLTQYLEPEGYRVLRAYNGPAAINMAGKKNINMALMDVDMPGMDGISLVKEIRKQSGIPIIIISARDSDRDKILGLKVGADDYIVKPFNPLEVVARVDSSMRRFMVLGGIDTLQNEVLYSGDLKLFKASRKVIRDGEKVDMTKIEYLILEYMLRNKGRIVTNSEIYRNIWKADTCIGSERTVSVHIYHIRRKLERNLDSPRYIKAVWGQGYKLEDLDED